MSKTFANRMIKVEQKPAHSSLYVYTHAHTLCTLNLLSRKILEVHISQCHCAPPAPGASSQPQCGQVAGTEAKASLAPRQSDAKASLFLLSTRTMTAFTLCWDRNALPPAHLKAKSNVYGSTEVEGSRRPETKWLGWTGRRIL